MANVTNNAGFFFQTDAELAKEKEKQAKCNYTVGDAMQLSTKALDLKVVQQGKYAFVAESGSMAKRIHLDTKKVGKIYRGHAAPVTSIALSQDGEVLWTGSWDKTIKKWDTKSGECLATLQGHSDFVKCLEVVGNRLYSGSADTDIRQWDVNTHECLAVMKHHGRSVERLVAAPPGYLYSASSDRSIVRWDLTTLEVNKIYEGHETNVTCLVISPEDDLWSGSADKTARRWNPETGEVDTVLQHSERVKSITLLGPYVVTGCSDDNIYVWDIASGKLKHTLEGHFDEVGCLGAFGSVVYSASLDNSLRRWTMTPAALAKYEEEARMRKMKIEPKADGPQMTEDEERELMELLEDD
ncbi:WD40 repeat-like protein [Hesseltinella vesiculosa]|uniref:WD40 repeat-like protein n=1 Tax=Hesseltinella vesiculosa TaxID=101127 RepID=A0A1X2GJW9_9FUNG|nr:WD40 repeat-like protein [Hesseltinella vesiculosa]